MIPGFKTCTVYLEMSGYNINNCMMYYWAHIEYYISTNHMYWWKDFTEGVVLQIGINSHVIDGLVNSTVFRMWYITFSNTECVEIVYCLLFWNWFSLHWQVKFYFILVGLNEDLIGAPLL